MSPGCNKIMLAVLGIASMFLLSCKKDNITTTAPMKEIFYTQEGHAYILKSITKNLTGQVIAAPLNNFVNVQINAVPIIAFAGLTLQFNTTKNIIPVQINGALINEATNAITVDVQAVYYDAIKSLGAVNYQQQSSQVKLWPYVDRIYYTDDNHYGYNVRYNQVVFSTNDFIDVNSTTTFRYKPTQAQGLINIATGFTVIPAATYSSSVTFVYFELL